jgi:endonuclease/exonuclease/phosphatase family metal-dependent hydrolase
MIVFRAKELLLSHPDRVPRRPGRLGVAIGLGLVFVLALALLPRVPAAAAKPTTKGTKLTVMTRNLYVGAEVTPALQTNSVDQLVDTAGAIVRQVHATKFPSVRAASIAAEIRKRKPDLVGLQEVARWRTAQVDLNAALGTPSASQTDPLGGDFLADLLKAVNSGGKRKKGVRYRAVIVNVNTGIDVEVPVNDDGNGSGLAGADHNERLTVGDAILVRKGVGIKTSHPSSGTYDTLLRIPGVKNFDLRRGWTAVDVKARGLSFRFVNTHLESGDSQGTNQTNLSVSLGKGEIRAAQARQLVGPGGAAKSKKPVILLGDINSDDDTVPDNGDRNAYTALLAAGFRERSRPNPLSCCLNDPFLVGGPNSINDFDHQVDHVLTNKKRIKFVKGFVDGRAPVNGLYPSDHAALTSVLKIR